MSSHRSAARLASRSPGLLRRAEWLVPVVIAALPFIVLAPAMASGLLAIEDGWLQYFPVRTLAAEQLASGEIPAWTGVQFSGFGLHELGSVGALYPLNVVLNFLPSVLAYNLGLAAALSVNSLGTFLLARRISGSSIGAAVAAIGYGYGPFMIAELSHPDMLTSLAWIPWALLGLVVAQSADHRRRGVALAAGAFALCVFGGHQQMVSCCALLLLGWGVISTVVSRDRRARDAINSVAALALGAAIGAVQLLPSLATASGSGRSAYTYEQASALSLELRQLPLIIFPYASGGAGDGGLPVQIAVGFPVLGVVLLVLAAGAIPLWRRDRQVLTAVCLAAVVFVAVLSPALPPLGRAVYELPFFGLFRGWTRFTLIPKLMLALLASVTVARLSAGARSERLSVLRWSVGAAALYLVGAAGLQVLPVLQRRSTPGLALPVAIAAVAAGMVAAAATGRSTSGRRIARLGLIALVGVESLLMAPLAPWDMPTVPMETVEVAMDPLTAARFVADEPGGIDRYAFVGRYEDVPVHDVIPRAPLSGLSGALSVNGYSPLASQRYLDALGMDFYGSIDDPSCLLDGPSAELVLDVLRVTSLIAPTGTPAAAELTRRGAGEATPGPGYVRWDRSPGRSQAWLADPAEVAAIAGAGADVGCDRRTAPTAIGRVDSDWSSTGRLTARTETAADAVLVLSVAPGAGWHASVDGREVEVEELLGVAVGVPVPSGAHEVALEYRIPRLRMGLLVTVAGLAATAVLLVPTARLRPRRSRRS